MEIRPFVAERRRRDRERCHNDDGSNEKQRHVPCHVKSSVIEVAECFRTIRRERQVAVRTRRGEVCLPPVGAIMVINLAIRCQRWRYSANSIRAGALQNKSLQFNGNEMQRYGNFYRGGSSSPA